MKLRESIAESAFSCFVNMFHEFFGVLPRRAESLVLWHDLLKKYEDDPHYSFARLSLFVKLVYDADDKSEDLTLQLLKTAVSFYEGQHGLLETRLVLHQLESVK